MLRIIRSVFPFELFCSAPPPPVFSSDFTIQPGLSNCSLIDTGGGMSNIVRDNNIIDFSKIGYNLVSFQSWTLEKAFKVIADVGYSTVELCLEHPEMDPEKLLNGDIARIKAALEENGLRTSAISCNFKDANLDATFSECVKALDVALELGTKIFTISAPPENLDPGGQLTRQTLSKLLQIADDKGIIIAIENEPDSVIHGFYDFSMLISELINLPLGLNLNLSHAALTEQDVAAVINEFASHIVRSFNPGRWKS